MKITRLLLATSLIAAAACSEQSPTDSTDSTELASEQPKAERGKPRLDSDSQRDVRKSRAFDADQRARDGRRTDNARGRNAARQFKCTPAKRDAAKLTSATIEQTDTGATLTLTVPGRKNDEVVEVKFDTRDDRAVFSLTSLFLAWNGFDNFLSVDSVDAVTYTSADGGGLSLGRNTIAVTCVREAKPELSADDRLLLHVAQNKAAIETAVTLQLLAAGAIRDRVNGRRNNRALGRDERIQLGLGGIRCLSDGTFVIGEGKIDLGVCLVGGDLPCPNCSSVFSISVGTDGDHDKLVYSGTVLASEI